MNYFGKIFTAAVTFVLCCTNIFAQEQNPADTAASSKPAFPENAPMMRQDGAQKLYYIRDINIHGVQYLNSDILKSSAGLIAGDSIYLPSNFIANAISRLWSQRFFSDVKIGAEIEGDSLDLEVFLKERPVSTTGISKASRRARRKTCWRSSNSSGAANYRIISSTRTKSSSRPTGRKKPSAIRRWTCASPTTRCARRW